MFNRKKREIETKKKEITRLIGIVEQRTLVIVDLFINLSAANEMIQFIAEHPMGGNNGKVRAVMREIQSKVTLYKEQLIRAGLVKEEEQSKIVTPDHSIVAPPAGLKVITGGL